MKHWQIGQLAKECDVSIRTLRHYDRIGLLNPSSRSEADYRLYSEQDRHRLSDILFYRALGFSLHDIGVVLDSKLERRSEFLQQQHQALELHIKRLLTLRKKLRQEIDKENKHMKNTSTVFDALDGFDPDSYEDEVIERWGKTSSYKHAANRTAHYTQADWARYKAESKQLNNELAHLFKSEVLPSDIRALELVEKLRLQIDEWFYPCSHEMHASLGEMYISDERFTAFYDEIEPGLAEYLRAGTVANLKRSHEN